MDKELPNKELMAKIAAGLAASYSEQLLYVAIEQEAIAGSRKVLFQAATNKRQTFLDGTKAS
jgi:hypothetical protein